MKAPWHLWVVGGISLLWHAGGAFNYAMTQLGSEAILAELSVAERAYLESFPTLYVVFWALAVWGAVLGSILLLMRRALAGPVFTGALLSMLISAVWSYAAFDPSAFEIGGWFLVGFSAVVAGVLAALAAYARAMTARGVLI